MIRITSQQALTDLVSPSKPWPTRTPECTRKAGAPAALTQTDEHPLQGLVGRRLQVEERELVVRAQLRLVPDGLEQGRCPVELQGGDRERHPVPGSPCPTMH